MRACGQSVEDRVLRLEVHNSANVAVLRCWGRIVQGDGADDLLRAVMSQDKRNIQIELSGVNAIDAGGLGVLVALERWAREGNRSIRFVNPSKHVREALEATRLTSVLQICRASAQQGGHDAA
jgi:anti-sigma B factor antagonist